MSVPLTGVAGFFTRQGAIIGEYNRVASFYGSALDAGFLSIWSQFASSDQQAVENLPSAVSGFRSSGLTYQNTLVQDGQLATTLQVGDDTSVVPNTVAQAVTVLAGQMRTNSQSINRPTLGSTVTANVNNVGDVTVATSTVNPYGDPLDMMLAETITATVVSTVNTYSGTAQFVGQAAVASVLPTWPGGSGANLSVSITDPANDTLVTDGGFEDWGSTGNNTPLNWEIINGDAGVTVSRGTGGVRGNFTAVITSNGTQATQLGQDVTVQPNTVYCAVVYAKVNASDGTGVFRIALTDDNGTVLTNDAGTSLSYTRNLSAQVTSSFQCFTVFFQTPRQLPVGVNLRFGYSIAPANGVFLTLDLAGFVAVNALYAGGPYVAAFAGAEPTAIADQWSVAYTNSLTSQSFARGMDRLYGLRQLGVYLPSSVSPTVPDNLVTH
jgi:hypothetical protein